MYAADQLQIGKAEGDLESIFRLPAEQWQDEIVRRAQAGEVSEVSMMEDVHRRMEATVLNLPSGSFTQRVQAEFLKEFEARAKMAFAKLV